MIDPYSLKKAKEDEEDKMLKRGEVTNWASANRYPINLSIIQRVRSTQ